MYFEVLQKQIRIAKIDTMWGNGRKYFDCIDLHCGGEPARVMFSTNCPPIPGKSMAQKRESMIKSFDQIRRVLLQVKSVVEKEIYNQKFILNNYDD